MYSIIAALQLQDDSVCLSVNKLIHIGVQPCVKVQQAIQL
jgi:hypothetical protein